MYMKIPVEHLLDFKKIQKRFFRWEDGLLLSSLCFAMEAV